MTTLTDALGRKEALALIRAALVTLDKLGDHNIELDFRHRADMLLLVIDDALDDR